MAKLGNCCEETCCVNDAVCCDVVLTQGSTVTQPIWTDNTNYVINGTVVVENNGPTNGPSADIIINGTTVTPPSPIAPGQCRSFTVNDLNSVALLATAGSGTAGTTSSVKVSFSLNYKF